MHIRQILLFIGIIVCGLFLRIYQLGTLPIALHGDEAGVGYNAYSIAHYGIDEYGKFLPVTFRADVTPLIFYFTAPFTFFLGTYDWVIRLPSVVVGILTIAVVYIVTQELVINIANSLHTSFLIKYSKKIALLCSFFVAFSPWEVQINRIAHDAQYGNLIQLVGIYFYFKYLRKHDIFSLVVSGFFFGFSFYSYHAPRLTTPIIIFLLLLLYSKGIGAKKYICFIVITLIVSSVFWFNLLMSPLNKTRIAGINIVSQLRAQKTPIYEYPLHLAINYIQQFSLKYLYLDSQSTRYFQVKNVGLELIITLPFFLLGLIWLLRNKQWLLPCLLLASTLPGFITSGPPNAGRNALLFPLIELITGIGCFYYFYLGKKSNSLFKKILFGILIGLSIGIFMHQYFIDSKNRFYTNWQYGYAELAQKIIALEGQVENIIVSDQLKQMYVYILLSGEINPNWLSRQENKIFHPFIGYSQFGKYSFRALKYDTDKNMHNSILVGLPSEIPASEASQIVYDPYGKILFILRRQ